MDLNPITKQNSLVISGNRTHASLHYPVSRLMVDA